MVRANASHFSGERHGWQQPSGRRTLLACVVLVHGLVFTALASLPASVPEKPPATPVTMRFMMVAPPVQPPPPPRPPPPKPVVKPEPPKPQQIAARIPEPQPQQAPVMEEPPPPPEPEPAPVPAEPAPVVPPNFVAAYLDNPRPAYPPVSKQLRETGKVILRVLVNAAGRADDVQIQTSSGHPRLDRAALEAVKRWRFVPARQGDVAIAASVLVPVSFGLE